MTKEQAVFWLLSLRFNPDNNVLPNEAIDMAIGAIVTQPKQRWIPVSEKLPRQGQEVICQCRANIIEVLKLDADGNWYQHAEHCYMGSFVIAWMPLPEPYQAERRE